MSETEPVRMTVRNPSGLHARPAAMFVRGAGGFQSAIRVTNVTRGTGPADAKSIIAILGLGVSAGHEIEVTADGADAAQALDALRTLVAGGLGEDIGGGVG
jgi:phosphotransferase system HPr (HPr) family protein